MTTIPARRSAPAARRSLVVPSLVLALLVALGGCGAPPEQGGVPEDVVRLNVLGTAYLGQQKWAEAEQSFREALGRRPQDPLLRNNVAVALIQQGRLDEAEALLGQALTADPAFAQAHYNLGLLLKNRGEFAQAAEHFEAVERFDPSDLLTHYNLGIVYSRLDRAADAEARYRRSLELDPTHVSSLYALGRLLLQAGDQEEGIALISESQAIRARSGLDEAVGSQYGEQGPYAMGADYPADALAAPAPIPVAFETSTSIDLAGHPAGCAASAWSAGPLGASGPGAVFVVDAVGAIRVLAPGGDDTPILAARPGSPAVAVAAGDVDDDEVVDVVALLAASGGWRPVVLRPAADGSWSESAAGAVLPFAAPPALARATLVDRDHDGDVDLFWCWASSDSGGCALGTNDGSGRFDLRRSADHGFDPAMAAATALTVAFSDFDNDRDIDLLVARDGRIGVYANQRDGTFLDVSADAGLAGAAADASGALAVADLDKDASMDLVAGTEAGARILFNRRGRFEPGPLLGPAAAGAAAAVVLDHDNDGFLDLALADGRGARVQRNLGVGAWTGDAPVLKSTDVPVAALDADGDGDLDLIGCSDGEHAVWSLLSNEGGNAQGWIRVVSRGVADNKLGIGSKVEILAGALRQKFEITSPLPLHAGLGRRDSVESVRYLWPSGILQDEIGLQANSRTEVLELDRKGTSCPLLYARGAEGWRFVTDFLGGCAIGYLHAPGVYSVPDTDEYVKVEGGIVPESDGTLLLRVNNQLQEVIWFDQLELVVVDHPAGSEVFPNERLMPGPPFPAFELFVSDDVRPIASARGVEDGADLTELLAAADRRWVENFARLPFKGYAVEHTVEIDLGAVPRDARVVLLLDGWIDYADSSANLAAHQAGLRLAPPRLTVADGRGGWLSTGHRMGFPAGLPKTMAVELTGLFPSDDHRLRIATNMRIYWDRARLLVDRADAGPRVRRLRPIEADLRFGGFPAESSPDGRPPFGYDPARVEPLAPWSVHVGRYTAFGDVRERLLEVDDRLVTTRSGDEIELRFPDPGPPAPGRVRTYLLYADGFGKDMDPNSAAALHVGPVPFHGMPSYPYPDGLAPPRRTTDPGEAPGRYVLESPRGWPGALPQPLAAGERADGP